jgi:F0F1-type ATP synthase membrane subunit b/b'
MGTTVKPDNGSSMDIFDGYKVNVAEGLEKELRRLKTDAESEANRIISEAEQHAQVIFQQADERAKQEAAEKTRQDILKILSTAEETANTIITEAKKSAQQQSDKMIANAIQEATIQSNTLKANVLRAAEEMNTSAAELHKQAEHEAKEAVAKARLKAENILQRARDKAKNNVSIEVERILSQAKNQAAVIVDEAIQRVKISLDEYSTETGIVSHKFRQYIKDIPEHTPCIPQDTNKISLTAPITPVTPTVPVAHDEGPGDSSGVSNQPPVIENLHTPAIVTLESKQETDILDGETIQSVLSKDAPLSVNHLLQLSVTANPNQEPILYYGQVELHITKPVDEEQLHQFTGHLSTIPHVNIVQSNASLPDGTVIVLRIEMAIPLFDVIKKLPSVKEAENVGKDIMVTLLPFRNKSLK